MHASASIALRHFLVENSAPGGHPLHVARAERAAVSEAVSMVDASREHIRDRLNAPVRMPRKSGPIIIGMIVAEIVEQQERIELVRIAEAEGATQLHPRAFHRGCGFNNALHRPNRHDEPLSGFRDFA